MAKRRRKNRIKRLFADPALLIQKVTAWVGSLSSLIAHTVFFVICFISHLFGIAWDTILLVLTTVVSLEAIYLAIFIQMTVNDQAKSLDEVSEDIGEIQEDIAGVEKDIDEMQEDIAGVEKDIDEIQEDIDEITEEDEEEVDEDKLQKSIDHIQISLQRLVQEVELLKEVRNKENSLSQRDSSGDKKE
jgi:uncharacterized membrane protein